MRGQARLLLSFDYYLHLFESRVFCPVMTQPIRPIVVTIVIVIRVILAVAINQAHDLLWIHISAAFGSSFQQLLAQKICSTFLVRHSDI